MSIDQPGTGDPKNDLKAIRIFFKAIIAGALLFAVIVIVLNNVGNPSLKGLKGMDNIFLIVAAVIAAACFIIAGKLYGKNLEPAKDPLISLADKLNRYRATLILYVALCEGPALFSIIVFFLTGNYISLIITAAMITAMLLKSPTLERLVADLDLDSQQEMELE